MGSFIKILSQNSLLNRSFVFGSLLWSLSTTSQAKTNEHLAPAISIASELSKVMSPMALETSEADYKNQIDIFIKKTKAVPPSLSTYREVKGSQGTLSVLARLNSVKESFLKKSDENQILLFVSFLEGSSTINNFLSKHSDKSAYTKERLSKVFNPDEAKLRNDQYAFTSWNDRFQIKDIPVGQFSPELQTLLKKKLLHFEGKEKLSCYVMADLLRFYNTSLQKEVLVVSVRVEVPSYDKIIVSGLKNAESEN